MSLTPEQQAHELILRARRILVVTKEHAPVDALASAVACALFLKKIGKETDVVSPETDPKTVPSFLPQATVLKSRIGAMRAFHITLDVGTTPLGELLYDVRDNKLEIQVVPKNGEWTSRDVSFKPGEDRYDLVIALDCPDIRSLGDLSRAHADFLYRTTIINIDCDAGNEHWGQVNLVDPNAVSTTEILFRLIDGWNRLSIDEDLATALLAGMISRTKSFRTPNVTPHTLATASQLTALGARRAEIVQGMWRTRTVPTLKLWGRALSRLEHDRDLGLVWMALSRQDLLETGATEETIEGVTEELVSYAPEAKVVALIHERAAAEGTFVSLHATPPFSAADLARPFGANGSRTRAAFRLEPPMPFIEGIKTVVDRLRKTMIVRP